MTGPTLRARQLGMALAQLRSAAHVTQKVAGEILECSQSKIAQVEAGRNTIRRAELIVLLQHYGADQATIDRLDALRLDAARRGWWSTYDLPNWLLEYVGLEADATSVRTLALEVLPGLLQTEQCARQVIGLDHRLPDKEVDRRIAVRMQRQQRLTGPDPLQLSAVLSESALLRCAKQPDVGASQLRHLVEQSGRDNIELLVMPIDVGLYIGVSGGFTLLSFPEGLLPDTVHQEYLVGGHLVDAQSVVDQLTRIYGELRDQALDANESLTLITELMDHT
ncbi:MAG: helix-turn-helix domain-containing protein [Pseudonocardiaceae bacterium]